MSTKCDLQTFQNDELIACTNKSTHALNHTHRTVYVSNHQTVAFYWHFLYVFSGRKISKWLEFCEKYKSIEWKTTYCSLSFSFSLFLSLFLLHTFLLVIFIFFFFLKFICNTFNKTYHFNYTTESFSDRKFIIVFVQTCSTICKAFERLKWKENVCKWEMWNENKIYNFIRKNNIIIFKRVLNRFAQIFRESERKSFVCNFSCTIRKK